MRKLFRFVRSSSAILFLLGLHSTFVPAVPVIAQGNSIPGTRVFPISTRTLNVAQAAHQDSARVPQPPSAAPRPAHPTPSTRSPQSQVIQSPQQSRVLSPAPEKSYLALDDNNVIIPPDTMGAVGVDHLVTMLNSQVRIQDKKGGNVSTLDLGTFWSQTSPFDPRVVFDPLSFRWISVVVANARSASSLLCIAVSQTSAPDSWNQTCFDVDSTNVRWADFPAVGFNKDWIIVTVNMAPIVSGFWQGQIYAINKANFYAGIVDAFFWSGATIPIFQMPALTLDPTINSVYLIDNYNSATGTLRKSVITGSAPTAPTLTTGTAFVTSTLGGWLDTDGELLPQFGGTRKIDLIDPRIHNAVVRTINGVTSLWCTQNINLSTRFAAQWWQLDANPYSSIIYQQGLVQDPTATVSNGGYHYAYPSLAVNQYGDMLIGFSRFSSATYASAAYALRLYGDPWNTTRDPIVYKSGEGYYDKDFGYGINRWGDYSHTVVDPLGDINFWTIQEYAATPIGFGLNPGRWGTWWGFVKISLTTPSEHFFPRIGKE